MMFVSMLLIISFCLIFKNNSLVSESIFESLSFCAKTIIPSLYVYMVFSEAFIRANALDSLNKIMNKVLKISEKQSNLILIFIISVLCGAPIGAKLSYGAYKCGKITKKEAILLNISTNNISMSFVYGICSQITPMYKVVFVIQIISSVITAYIFSKIIIQDCATIENFPTSSISFKISEIIKSATSSMISVCSSIIFFALVSDIIGIYLPRYTEYIKGFFEFSSGVINLKNNEIIKMTSFLSFGGFSIHSQIMSIWEKELKYKYLLIPKIIQTLLSVIFCEIFLLFVDNTKVLM